MKTPTTPAEKLTAATTKINDLSNRVDTLERMIANQNQITAAVRREWSMWAKELQRMHAPESLNAAFMLAQLST